MNTLRLKVHLFNGVYVALQEVCPLGPGEPRAIMAPISRRRDINEEEILIFRKPANEPVVLPGREILSKIGCLVRGIPASPAGSSSSHMGLGVALQICSLHTPRIHGFRE